MSSGPGPELVREYVAVLRGIGLTEGAVAEVHGGDRESGEELAAYLSRELGDAEEVELRRSLAEAIARSPRGIDAPHEYWNHAPEVHLEELLAPYGCEVTVEPARGADTLADGKLVVRLADATGTAFWTRFEYPESALAEDNYPALLHHVESELLAGTGLRFVRLTAPPGRWRFAMMTEAQLSALQDRYGERVEVFGGPLLAIEQPEAFASQVPPIPPGYDRDGQDRPERERGPALEREAAESLDDVAAAGGEPDADEIDLGLDDPAAASPDRIVESVQQAGAGSGSTAAAAGADGVEATDEELQSVFGDLSSVSLEPEEPDPEAEGGATGGETLTIDGGTVAADEEDPLDDLFDEIKRDVAGSTPTTGTEVSAGNEASVSDLVDGAVEDDAAGRDGDPGTPDVPDEAADLTASELFGDLDGSED